MAPWWGARTGGPRQHDPFVSTAGLCDSPRVAELVGAAGVLVQPVAEAAARGGGAGRDGAVGRVRNAGATPARNSAATRTSGHRLAFTATSQSSVGLTFVSSIAPSPLNGPPCAPPIRLARERDCPARAYLLRKRGNIPLWGAHSNLFAAHVAQAFRPDGRRPGTGSPDGLRYERPHDQRSNSRSSSSRSMRSARYQIQIVTTRMPFSRCFRSRRNSAPSR